MNHQMRKLMFSSLSGDWNTPKELYEQLNEEFHFDFDPCPSNHSFDGLSCEWGKSNFVNPPYGRIISKWIEKGYSESLKGRLVVMLLPSRTDTKWFHNICTKGEIRFIKGRLTFTPKIQTWKKPTPAPFPSVLVIFRGED